MALGDCLCGAMWTFFYADFIFVEHVALCQSLRIGAGVERSIYICMRINQSFSTMEPVSHVTSFVIHMRYTVKHFQQMECYF